MILTPQRRAALIKELSLLSADSLLSVVMTVADNAATVLSTFEDPYDVPDIDAYKDLWLQCDRLLTELQIMRVFQRRRRTPEDDMDHITEEDIV